MTPQFQEEIHRQMSGVRQPEVVHVFKTNSGEMWDLV